MDKSNVWQRLASIGWKGIKVWSILVSIGVPSMAIGFFHDFVKGWEWYYQVLLFGGMFLFLLGILTLIVANFKGGKHPKDTLESDSVDHKMLEGLQTKIEELRTEIKEFTSQRVEWGKLSSKQIEDTINRWATIPYFAVIPRPNAVSLFNFAITGSDGTPINITRLKENPDQVIFGVKADLTQGELKKYKDAFDSLGTASQVDLLAKLRLEMVRLNVNYEGIALPLENITLIVVVSLNDLSGEVYFREHFDLVRRANLLLFTLITQHLMNAGKISLQDSKYAKTQSN